VEAQLTDQTPVKVTQARQAQSDAAKRATKEMLFGKPSKPATFIFTLDGERVTLQFRAVGAKAYDRMLTACPPTVAQRAEGSVVDNDKFAPKLLAAVCIDPVLTEEEWGEIWGSDSWSQGEVWDLFTTANGLCRQGLDLTPTEAG
jgi:hypothetical protein